MPEQTCVVFDLVRGRPFVIGGFAGNGLFCVACDVTSARYTLYRVGVVMGSRFCKSFFEFDWNSEFELWSFFVQ